MANTYVHKLFNIYQFIIFSHNNLLNLLFSSDPPHFDELRPDPTRDLNAAISIKISNQNENKVKSKLKTSGPTPTFQNRLLSIDFQELLLWHIMIKFG